MSASVAAPIPGEYGMAGAPATTYASPVPQVGATTVAPTYVVHQPGQQPTVVSGPGSASFVPQPGAAPHPGAVPGMVLPAGTAPGTMMMAPGAPGAPGAPMRPSSELPDPESIERQKKMYERSLDEELQQSKIVAEQQVKARKDALRMQAEQQLAMYKAQLEQHVKQEELVLDQGLQQQNMQLQQQLLHQKAVLEQQATSLSIEYQQRKMHEDMHRQQMDMHKEMQTMQERMAKELAEHQMQAAQLQQQHQMQAQHFRNTTVQQVPQVPVAAAMPAYSAGTLAVQQLPPMAPMPGAPGMQQPQQVAYAVAPGAPATARQIVVTAPGVTMPAGSAAMPVLQGAPPGAPAPGAPPTTVTTVMQPPGTIAEPSAGYPSSAILPGATSMHLAAAQPMPAGVQATTVYPQQQPQQVYTTATAPAPAAVVAGQPRRVSVFDAIDQNHDGFITRQEWQAAGGA